MRNFHHWILSAGMAGVIVLPVQTSLMAEETAVAPEPAADPAVAPAPAPANDTVADDWQAKLDAQMTKTKEASTPAVAPDAVKTTAPASLDKATQKLVSDIQTAAKGVAAAATTLKTEKSDKAVRDWFKAQWQLLRLVPEASYKTAETRKAMAGENEETKAYLKENEATLKTMSELFVRFKQRLGLRSDRVEMIAKRMNVKGPVDETKGAAASAGSGDISLGEPDPKTANVDMAASITATEKYRIQLLETYLKRLGMEDQAKNMVEAEKDFKEAAKVLDGAYFFQVLYKQTPAVGTQYPETLKFLKTLNGGLGDLRAYEELLAQAGLSVDENGELTRAGDPGQRRGGDANAAGDPATAPQPGFNPNGGWGGGGPRGGGGGGPRGGGGGGGGGRGR